MLHQATLRYSEHLVRQSVLVFWRRTVGIGYLAALAAIGVILVIDLWRGDRSWRVGAMAVLLAAALAFAVAIYVNHLRFSMSKLREMGSPDALFIAEDATFTMNSAIGGTTLQWSAVKEVWRFQEFWLLLFSRAQFVTLPIESVPAEMRVFILERITAAGGKVSG